jgi:hypothetical protein
MKSIPVDSGEKRVKSSLSAGSFVDESEAFFPLQAERKMITIKK